MIFICFIMCKLFWDAFLFGFLQFPPMMEKTYQERVVSTFISPHFFLNVFCYWGILGGYYGVNYYQKYRHRELKAAALETQLAQAQLQVLKMQLQPHFLFNTLNSISSLLYEDVKAADDMITLLSDLLRYSLTHNGVQEVKLKEEIDILNRYLEIEQIRFSNRLTVKYDIDPRSLASLVPTMILQPLAENAIRHGIAKRASAGRILIRTRREEDRIEIRIQDNGPGIAPKEITEIKEGTGLSNTRMRLEQLYGPGSRLDLSESKEGEMIVRVTIPYHENPTDLQMGEER
ncbi:MAG: sensor histidine kinase [Candidatus Omnitrophota bacterium]|nr:MAG: sensor histidine kinase [Candidatus Omnitrophota bacterium]